MIDNIRIEEIALVLFNHLKSNPDIFIHANDYGTGVPDLDSVGLDGDFNFKEIVKIIIDQIE